MQTALALQPVQQLAEYQSARVAEYAHRLGDTAELMELDHAQRKNKPSVYAEVCVTIEAMLCIDELVAGGMGLVQARRNAAEHFRGWPGMTLGRLNAKHSVWRNGGMKADKKGKPTGEYFQPHDWRYFVPTYNNGEVNAMLANKPFCMWLAGQVGQRPRKGVGYAVRRDLLDLWMRDVAIDGIGKMSQWCAAQVPPRAVPRPGTAPHPDYYPAGWSPSNIERCIKRELGQRDSAKAVFMQLGEHAAMSFWGDQLYRTRANLRPLELITADDVDLDVLCWMPLGDGTVQIVRPKVLFILDVATARILNFGAVGAYTRNYYMDGGDKDTKRALQGSDMKELTLATLEMYGIPQNWTMHHLHENATSRLSKTDEAMFEKYLPIKFGHTEMMHTTLPGGFLESCGNPKQKGWVESLFNLFHNEFSIMPASLGPRYDRTRGDVGTALWRGGKQVASRKGTLVHEALAIIKKAAEAAKIKGCDVSDLLDYSAQREGTFDMPLLGFSQLMETLAIYVDRLNARTEHSLEGFEQVIDVEVAPGEFLPATHPAAKQVAHIGMRCRTRLESPDERFARLSYGQPFRKLHPRELSVLAREIKPTTVTNERVTVNCKRYGLDDMIFRDAASAEALAKYNSRPKALVYFLGADARQVHLFTNDDAMNYVASPARVGLVDPMDKEAAGRRMGEVSRGRQAVRAEAGRIMAPRTAEITTMREHNAAVAESYKPVDRVANDIERAESTHRAEAASRKRLLNPASARPLQDLCLEPSPAVQDDVSAPSLSDLFNS
ncbi:MAG: hypothetical protein WC378_09055 [Opitutaceae bacterium]|jgi:hypothetical protein